MSFPTLANIRLRIQVDTTGSDPPTAQRQLEWNCAAADSVWRSVEVVGGGALAFGAQGATTTAGTTAPTVAYPTGITKGQLLVMVVGNRPNANTVTTPAGWTLPTNGSATGGAGAEAAGTGVVRGTVFLREADGTETGNVTLAITGGTSVSAVILRYTKTTGKVWNVAVVNGARNTASASYTATAGSDPGVTAGDILLVSTVTSEDTPTMASQLVTQTGVTFGTMVERVDQAVTTGNDQHLTVSEHPVTSGTGSAAPVFTMTASGTNAANTAGISHLIRIRQVNAPMVLSASANIAAGGATATTAQLTAPSGKTSGANFAAGDISDDTNPLPTLDLATDQYTEDEWCLQATATAVNGEVYQFRETLAGTPLTTYTQTPTWTIGAAATPNIRDVASRLKLTVRAYRDVASRLKLTVRAYRDTATRLKLTVRAYRDVATRLALNARTYKDVTSRVTLNVRAYRDAATRLNLRGLAVRDAATRLKLVAAGAGVRDVASRLKLTRRGYRDLSTRLRLGVQAYRDSATRLRLTVRTSRDTATRLRLNAATVYRDVRARMVLQGGPGQLLVTFTAPTLDENGQPLPGDLDGFLVYYGTAPGVYGPPIDIGHITTYLLTGLIHGTVYYVAIRSYDVFGNQSALSAESSRAADPLGTLYPHLGDVATRFRLSISVPRDIFTRFILVARQWGHVATRLTLQIRGYRNVATRLKLISRAYRDVASRLVLTRRGYRDVASRLTLSVRAWRDVASRVTLTRRGFTDISTRVRLSVAIPAMRDVTVRLRVASLAYKDTATRVRLALANAGIRDVGTRFRLRATAYQNTATRLMLGIRAYRDTATRLKLIGRGSRDLSTRLKLIARTFANVASRMVLHVRAYRDTATRLRLLRRGYRDVALRFRLQLLQTPGWRDAQARFVLALPQLAPSLVFASLAATTAMVSTVNLLAWASLSTPAALDSEERRFVFLSVSQPTALISTLDLLSWTSARAPTALVSEAR